MAVMKWIFTYIKKYRFRLLFAFTLTLGSTLLSNFRPYVLGKIIDEVFDQQKAELLIWLCALLVGSVLLKDVFRVTDHYILEGTSQRVVYSIRTDLYNRMCSLDFDFFDHNRTGDIMTRMSSDIESIRHFVAWVSNGVFENAALFVSAVVILCTINWHLTLAMLLITPFIAFFAVSLGKSVGPAFRDVRNSLSRLNTVVQENISGNRVVKAFAREDFEMGKFREANERYKEASLKSSRIWQKFIPYLDSLASSLNVVVLVLGGYLVITNNMTIGEFVTFNTMSWALNSPMRNVGWLINDTQNTMACASKVSEFMNERPHIYTKEGSLCKEHIEGKVEFRSVSFSYGDKAVLSDISFVAPVGKTVAILGATGSGKSSLVNLICRFYDATEGSVLIDNVDIRDYNLRRLRQNISIAMQDIFLFSDTIEGNIAYGAPDADMDSVRRAAVAADADEFIKQMPQGYDTIIGERGVGLSGGQKQRIALARALLHTPSILILDDTTSSVDIETEHYIQQTLRHFSKDRTTFIIAHRISAVKDADLILVLDAGRIVQRGTHSELLSEDGLYREVFENQYGSFDRKEGERVGTK
ncbi:MAG: ABC transporter ATP-binding protein [Clostridia bacterium]|nr:ABC transporter ATP-binding protein [Clostridia bacterium]